MPHLLKRGLPTRVWGGFRRGKWILGFGKEGVGGHGGEAGCWVTFKCFLWFLCLVVVVEQFVVRVLQGGKVTIPKRVRELLDLGDGDYVRLGVLEVVKRRGNRV